MKANHSIKTGITAWKKRLLTAFAVILLTFTVVGSALAAITFQAAATNMTNPTSGNAATSLTIAKPASVVAGDFLLAQITFEKGTDAGTNTQLTPSGWTLVVRTNRSSDLGQAIFYRFAGASEPASYTFPFNQAVKAAGGILRYTGVHTTTPIIATSGNSGDSGALVANSVASEPNAMLLAFFGVKKTTTLSTPGGMTLRYTFQNPQDVTILAAEQAGPANPTGNRSSTAGTSDKWVAHQVTLRMANTPPVYTPPASQSATEGETKAFGLGSFSDPDAHTTWPVTVNWGDGSPPESFNATTAGSLGTRNHSYADNGNYIVTVEVCDGFACHAGTFSITVANVAPVVTAPTDQNTVGGVSTSFTLGSFSDPGVNDAPWTVAVDWGDGSSGESFTTSVQGALGSRDHTYADSGDYTVTVTVTDKDGNSGSTTFQVTVSVAPTPDLTASKTNNVGGSTLEGSSWTWTIHVANSGNAAASFTNGQTLLTDNLPNSNLTYGTASVANPSGLTGTVSCSIDSNNLTCTASGAVTLNASGSFDIQFTATPSAAGSYANPRSGGSCSVDSSSLVTESNEANNDCADTVTVNALPDLTVSKANNVSGNAVTGQNWTWTLTVNNTGGAAAIFSSGQTILSDNLPDANLTYGTPSVVNVANVTGDANIDCDIASNDLTCTASGGSVTLAATNGTFGVQFTATASAAGAYANPRSGGACRVDPGTQVAESNEANNDCNTDTVNVTVAPTPDLTILKSHTGNFTQGQTGAQYMIKVTNSGTGPSSGQVDMVDSLPAGLTATALSGTGWSCVLATLTCTRSDALAASSSYEDILLTVNVAGNAPSSVTNSATVSGGGDANTGNNTATDPTTINQTPPPATSQIILSSNENGKVGGLSYRDEDIIAFDPTTTSWSMVFDGSDVGLGNRDIDAFYFLPDGRLLLSVDRDFTLTGFGQVDDSDLLAFTPTSLGDVTTGSYTLYLDGSDVGLSDSGEDIDSVGLAQNGNLVIGVNGSFKVPGASGNDEDLFVLNNGVFGLNTSGTWALYFDGSDVALTSSREDIASIWFDHATNKLYFSTIDDYSLPGGLQGNEDDILICTYTSLGETTACPITRYWNGDEEQDFDEDAIDGLLLGNVPTVVVAAQASPAGVVAGDDTVEFVGDDADDPDELDGQEAPAELEQLRTFFLPLVTR